MKQLLFLLLFPCLAIAQYPGNAGQKITLGEQTTADGLVYRGLAADTTRKPSVDTMAFILLDTNTNIIWQYKKAVNNAWTRVGGSISSGVTGVLPVANGGTGITSLGTGVATFLGTPSSANLASVVTDEAGSGALVFATEPVFTNTIGIGGATASTSGTGITFPATQSASTDFNTLDDYEEGTWSTTFIAQANLTGTPVLSAAKYRKIGQLVFLEGKITGLSITSTNTQTYIAFGIPFTMNSNSPNQVGNVYTFISDTDISGVVFDWTGSDNTNLGILIPKTLITSTGSLTQISFSTSYISEN